MATNETTSGFEVFPLPTTVIHTSIQEFANVHKCDYVEAAGTMRFLLHKGVAKKVGKRRSSPFGRGKPTDIYEIPSEVSLKLIA
jgi:hypothetical protein